jgi:hypothetical protein
MLKQSDFELTEQGIVRLNNLLSDAACHYAAVEGVPGDGASVTFTFTPMGRSIEFQFSGGPSYEIE